MQWPPNFPLEPPQSGQQFRKFALFTGWTVRNLGPLDVGPFGFFAGKVPVSLFQSLCSGGKCVVNGFWEGLLCVRLNKHPQGGPFASQQLKILFLPSTGCGRSKPLAFVHASARGCNFAKGLAYFGVPFAHIHPAQSGGVHFSRRKKPR